MIHAAFTKSEIARRYYALKHPERNYSRQQAIRQFSQDVNIDRKIMRVVINAVFAEQKKM